MFWNQKLQVCCLSNWCASICLPVSVSATNGKCCLWPQSWRQSNIVLGRTAIWLFGNSPDQPPYPSTMNSLFSFSWALLCQWQFREMASAIVAEGQVWNKAVLWETLRWPFGPISSAYHDQSRLSGRFQLNRGTRDQTLLAKKGKRQGSISLTKDHNALFEEL